MIGVAGNRILCGIRSRNNKFGHSPPSALHYLTCQGTKLCCKLRKAEAKSYENNNFNAFLPLSNFSALTLPVKTRAFIFHSRA